MVLAGRRLGLAVGVFTMTATWVDGGYLNGTAEATYGSGLLHVQAPWGYALSLVLGGLWFAPAMRRHGFTTLLDPFERRFGKNAAALLYIPALTGEVFWTAAVLMALGTTFGMLLDVDSRCRSSSRRRWSSSTRCRAGCGRSPSPTSRQL